MTKIITKKELNTLKTYDRFLVKDNSLMKRIKYENLYTIKTLLNHKSTLKKIKELLLPIDLYKTLEYIPKHFYTMEFLNGTTLKVLMDNKDKNIFNYLYKLGYALEKINESYSDLIIGDLHEGNIMVVNNEIKIIDPDGFSIKNHENIRSHYLMSSILLSEIDPYPINKYPLDNEEFIIPNRNTDLFCYIMIILNTLGGTSGFYNYLNYEYKYLDYLSYLESIGLSKDLIYILKKIITKEDNINPYKEIKKIDPNVLESTNLESYQKKIYHY